MRCRWLSVLWTLSVIPLANFATTPAPLSRPLWGDICVKPTWNSVLANWESLGSPPAGTTIDLYISPKPHRENALIDTLYEVSDPDTISTSSSPHSPSCLYSPAYCCASGMMPTYPRSRSLSSWRSTKRRSITSTPGLTTTVYYPPPFQGHTAAAS